MLLLATALAALATAPRVLAQTAVAYVPTQPELAALFKGFGADPPVERATPNGTDWDSIRVFALADSSLVVAASTRANTSEAGDLFGKWVDVQLANNEKAQVRGGAGEAAENAVEDLRDFRLVYVDPESGRRVSDYTRLMRYGTVVAIVSSIGDPTAEDNGQIDNDRALAMVRVSEQVIGRMHYRLAGGPRVIANLEPFGGNWGRHGFDMWVGVPDGHVNGMWRVYRWCSDDPKPPCDEMINSVIYSGGSAELMLVRVDGPTAFGEVIRSADSATLVPGPVSLTLIGNGMARLQQYGNTIDLCGPDYLKLAPQELRDQSPCGA